jgi:hypothetical protein
MGWNPLIELGLAVQTNGTTSDILKKLHVGDSWQLIRLSNLGTIRGIVFRYTVPRIAARTFLDQFFNVQFRGMLYPFTNCRLSPWNRYTVPGYRLYLAGHIDTASSTFDPFNTFGAKFKRFANDTKIMNPKPAKESAK